MLVVALPVELNHDQQTALLTEYIHQQFVADGMCADVALQDTYGKHYQPSLLNKAERIINEELGEPPTAEERRSLREQLNTRKQTQEHHPDKKEHDHTRGR